jgi:hypothetical protein
MPTSTTIPITPGSGINLDAEQLTVGSNTVARENICIADPTAAANIAGVTAAGQLIVTSSSSEIIDPNNSSTALLGANGVFTGTFTVATGFASLAVEVDTDQLSANTSTTGLVVQWSEDGVNVGDADIAYILAQDLITSTLGGQTYVFPVKRPYYSIQYTNGATAQTVFRLQCILKVAPIVGALTDLGDEITGNMHSSLVRNLSFGRQAGGSSTFQDFTVKAASTAAVATDPALVVAVSPNNTVSVSDVASASAGNAPAIISIATSSTTVLASNAARKGCNLMNMSNETISLAFGSNAAVLYSGATLGPGGAFWMDAFDFTTAAINAISTNVAQGGYLGVQEYQ